MKKSILLSALSLFLPLTSCSDVNKFHIEIVQLGTHTSLDEINAAITKTLTDAGYSTGNYEIHQSNAEFQMDTANQIMSIIKERAKLVIPIATPIAQAASQFLKEETPIVFAAVSDPVEAGLVENLEAPEGNITGTSDAIQVDKILSMAKEIDPELDQLGFIYNPSESNSVSNLAKVEKYCADNSITLEKRTISAAAEMREIAEAISSRVDAIFVSDDNTVASAMSALSDVTKKNKIPCYVGADSMVKDGGMMTLGINYTVLGNETGKMAIEVIKGKKISELPVKVFDQGLNLYINSEYVDEIGITIPESVTEDQEVIYL